MCAALWKDSYENMYTLNSEPKALTGDKSEGIYLFIYLFIDTICLRIVQ